MNVSKLIEVYTEIEALIAQQESGQPIDETRLAKLRQSLAGDDEKMIRPFTPEEDKEIIRLHALGFGFARIGRRIKRDNNTTRNRFKLLERKGFVDGEKTNHVRLSSPYYYWRDIAAKNGISGDTFYQRTQIREWTYEKSATTPVQKQRRFTPAEDEQIVTLRAQGMTYKAIAEKMGRNQHSVEDRHTRIGRELGV